MESFLRERAAAAVIGVKTATLKKWRQRGRGPRGWFHLSATCVLYPSSEVESFIGDLQRAEPGMEAGNVEEAIDPRSALEQPNEAAQG